MGWGVVKRVTARGVREQVLAALANGPWWDDAVGRFVTFAGWRPSAAGRDAWGVLWSPVEGDQDGLTGGEAGHAFGPGPAFYAAAHPARSAAELLAAGLPDGRDPAPFAELARAPRDGGQAKLTIGLHPLGPLDRLATLLGPEHALAALLDEPVASREVLDRIADYHVQIATHYLAAGVDAGWLADDYAGAAGPLLSLRLWREMLLPGLTRIIAAYREAGALCFFHTCGRADALLGDLLTAGITAFNLEPAACNLPALRERYGPALAFIDCPAWLAGA